MCFGGGGGSNNSGGNDNDSGGGGNSFTETLANIFTPNDGASYVNGVLVDDRTGDRIEAGGTTSIGTTISGSANDTSNDDNEIPASFYESLPAPVTNPNAGSYNETQTDDKWGYTRADGTVVSAAQDMIDGGGKNFGGEVFGIRGGELVDLNGDGYVTKAEADAAGGLPQNFVSKISNASGATPLGSGLEPTGVAGVLNMPIVGSALTGGLAGLYTGARDLTGNFGYPGRPETSTNTDLDSIAGQLSGQDAINAAVNYAVADTSVPYPSGPESEDDVTVSTAAVDYGDEESRRQTLYGMRSGNKDYDRFTRGGGGYAFMPAYMRQFMTGEKFDVTAKRIQLADGSIAYETPDGRILSPEQFENTAQTVGALTVEGPEQQYEKGYSITDAAGNVTYYTPDGQITDSIA
jgi:hypothetical protein